MIDFLSSWAKGLGLAIVIVSILETLLPNNKTKKYIRTVMGIYILFSIISPFIENKDLLNVNNISLETYSQSYEVASTVDQSSMDKRIGQLYTQELEKDITKKLNEKGYDVEKCKVDGTFTDNEENTKINKITLKVSKLEEIVENKETIENTVVKEIEKIKKVNTNISNSQKEEGTQKISNTDIQNIKKFLIEEYGVNEKCLKIN